MMATGAEFDTKVRNYLVDDELNRNWLRVLPRLQQLTGGKEVGRWVTIEELPIFVEGPPQGGGLSPRYSSAAPETGVGQAPPSQVQEVGYFLYDEIEERMHYIEGTPDYWLSEAALTREEYIDFLCQDTMGKAGTAQVQAWLEGVPNDHLADLNRIAYVTPETEHLLPDGAFLGSSGISFVEKGDDAAFAAFYEISNRTIYLSPEGFNQFTFMHELGHHVTMRDFTGRLAVDRARDVGLSIIAEMAEARLVGDGVRFSELVDKMTDAGLRPYSLSMAEEFAADSYTVLLLGTEEHRRSLDELWSVPIDIGSVDYDRRTLGEILGF